MSSGCEDELTRNSLFEGGLLEFVRTNSPTSARHEDDLEYIRIWATPARRLVFWDGDPPKSLQNLKQIRKTKQKKQKEPD